MSNSGISMVVGGIPFTTCGKYYENGRQVICHGIKEGKQYAIRYAGKELAKLLPEGAVIVPIPNRCGYARETLELAHVMNEYSGTPIADVLRGKPRESQYLAKKEGRLLTSNDMGFHLMSSLPYGKTPVLIDNCADSGETAKSAYDAIGQRGEVLCFAVSDRLMAQAEENIVSNRLKR